VRGHLEWSKARVVAVDSVLLWKYVEMLAAPTDLCVLYDPQTEGIGARIAVSLLGWAAVGYLVWRRRESNPLLLVAVLSFFAFLFPVLNWPSRFSRWRRALLSRSSDAFHQFGIANSNAHSPGGVRKCRGSAPMALP
jgi:hypothetical protein